MHPYDESRFMLPRVSIDSLHRFPEYITVKDINDLVRVPTSVPMQVAAIPPTGALWSYSAVLRARPFIEVKLSKVSASKFHGERRDGRTDGRTDGRAVRRTDGRTNKQIKKLMN